jgi:hypothetical protein
METSFDIPPDAVRVWRGYRANSLAVKDFLKNLGSVFVPATVEMQIAVGLDCYIPSILAGLPDKPDSVPDETAILFWDSPQTYKDAFGTLAVRTYTLTHGPVYRTPSQAQFPVRFAGTLAPEQPYFLFSQPADWMRGRVCHLIGARRPDIIPEDFRVKLGAVLAKIQSQGDASGAIVCAGDDYLVYWELADAVPSDGVKSLRALLDWAQILTPNPNQLKAGLWDIWPGMSIAPGASLNFQFQRRWEHREQIPRPVAPDAVHVWRGYKAAAMSYPDFSHFLGHVFIPAALLLQPGAGLRAYVPSLVPNGREGLPDQTALMFWADQQTYRDAYGTVAVRAYKGLHSQVFDEPPSKTGFPIPFGGAVVSEQPYYLFHEPADWMLGNVRHFVGAVPHGKASDEFLKSVSDWIASYKQAPPQGVDGAIICASETYVAFWEHVQPGRTEDTGALASLAAIATPSLSATAENYVAPGGLWSQWAGIDLEAHASMNIQLDRDFYDIQSRTSVPHSSSRKRRSSDNLGW